MSIIKLSNLTKVYGKGNSQVTALKNINLEIKENELVAIMGPSGCGKSTLLNIIGCIDTYTSGKFILNNKEITESNLNKLSRIRNKEISFVFQNFALLREFSVLQNVLVPLNFRKISNKEKKSIATKYIEELGLYEFIHKKAKYLSGGQQQRVSIARALAQESDIILADEPTGALDQSNGMIIMNLLKELNKKGKTIIVVTHDKNVASFCDRIIIMQDGNIL